ncbi:MAG: cysteine hydrolase [Burkholderiales bacterium]|nr:cysteine hydrolase [Burkholderiales bacterium]
MRQVAAEPYAFPIESSFDPGSAALVIIDMQRDFCDSAGYMGRRGADVSAAQALVPRIERLRDAARKAGMQVIYTREGHHPGLGDLPPSKRAKTRLAGAEIGSAGALGRLLIRGEDGWDIVPDLAPGPDEVVIDKVGTGAFYATDLEHRLRVRHIEQIVLVGVTTGVCVSSTAREAADRGFHVLVLADCCAEPDPYMHEIAMDLLQVEGGYIATIGESDSLLEVLSMSDSAG